MHENLQRHLGRGDLPGLVPLVCRNDEVYVDVIVTKDPDGYGPMRRDTLFSIASLTKLVTAVAAMILVESEAAKETPHWGKKHPSGGLTAKFGLVCLTWVVFPTGEI